MVTIIMPELESEESAAERLNQQGKGPKILTPNQNALLDYQFL